MKGRNKLLKAMPSFKKRGSPEGLCPSGGGLGMSPRNLYFNFPLSLEGEGDRG